MADEAVTLVEDIETLKTMLAERDRIIKELSGKLMWAEEKYRAMELKYFGRKSEKYSPEEDKQNRLFDEAEEHASDTAAPVTEMVAIPANERKKKGRKPKIDDLPIHEPPTEDRRCPCCGKDRSERQQ